MIHAIWDDLFLYSSLQHGINILDRRQRCNGIGSADYIYIDL